MFKKIGLIFILLLGIGLLGSAVFLRMNDTSAATSATSSEVEEDFETTWNNLTSKWISSLVENPDEWIYIVYKENLAGNLGKDPNTGAPFPNHTLVEQWVKVDHASNLEIAVTRTTDTDSGNMWLGAEMNGKQINYYPAENFEIELPEPSTLKRIIDPDCVSFGQPFRMVKLGLSDDKGGTFYTANLTINYPEPEQVDGPVAGVFKGMEVKCMRDSQTGAPLSVEQVLIAENGEYIMLYQMYDFKFSKVIALPAEISSIIK